MIFLLTACTPDTKTTPEAADLEPDAFVFAPIIDVETKPALSIRSQTITLNGFNRPLLLKATSGTTVYINGEYRDYFSDNSTRFNVTSGQTVALAVSPSNQPNTDTVTTLEIGSYKTTFRVTTRSAP